MIRKTFLPTVGFLAAVTFAGCGDVNDKNRLSVYVCDAPATEFEQVILQISRVEVREAGSADTWTILPVEDGLLNLLNLVNGNMQPIASGVMDGGKSFDAVRLTFDPGAAVVTVGDEKITTEFDTRDATVTVGIDPIRMDGPNRPLLLDIDAAKTVSEIAGAENEYRIKPVVRFVDLTKTGALQGGLQIGESLPGKQILIRFTHNRTGEIFSTYSVANTGTFFIRLLPGDYRMEILPPADMDIKNKRLDITIVKQLLSDQGIITLEADTTTTEEQE